MPDIEATGSLNKVPLTTEEHIPDLGLLFFRRLLSPSVHVSCLFRSFSSASSFSPICLLSFFTFSEHSRFSLSYLNVTVVKDTRLQSTPAPPSLLPSLSFLNCSLSKKVASRCVLNYCDTHRQVHYLYGESAFLKG